ncbi:hypothetical protein HDE_09609 [Halotydeus destructor]|nr:hypothetical protein HDE_09609 [Halotydeus destructor]
MVLEIFGSVFGRSKKSTSGLANGEQPSNGSPSSSRRVGDGNNGSEGESDQGFLLLNQPSSDQASSGVYPTILTDDMLRSPVSGATNAMSNYNFASLPFSTQSPQDGSVPVAQQYPGHQRQASSVSTPMDNVPFTTGSAVGAAKIASGSQLTDLGKCFQVVDRIGVFLSTPSQSDYNFSFEHSVVRENQASQSFSF